MIDKNKIFSDINPPTMLENCNNCQREEKLNCVIFGRCYGYEE